MLHLGVSLNYLLCIQMILVLLFFNSFTSFTCGWFTTFTNEIFLFVVFIFLVVDFFFFFYLEKSAKHFCKVGLVVLNSFSFCLSVKVLISPSNLNEILSG